VPPPVVTHLRVTRTRNGRSFIVSFHANRADTLDFTVCETGLASCPDAAAVSDAPLVRRVRAGANRFRLRPDDIGGPGRHWLVASVPVPSVFYDPIVLALAAFRLR
jgi:hypothetical protein